MRPPLPLIPHAAIGRPFAIKPYRDPTEGGAMLTRLTEDDLLALALLAQRAFTRDADGHGHDQAGSRIEASVLVYLEKHGFVRLALKGPGFGAFEITQKGRERLAVQETQP